MHFCKLKHDNKERLIKYLIMNKLSFFQLSHPRIYHKICHEALKNPHVLLYTAQHDDQIVGFIFVVVNKNVFLKKIVLTDPLLAYMMISRRIGRTLVNIFRKKSAPIAQNTDSLKSQPGSFSPLPIQNDPITGLWEENNNDIAKVIMIHISEKHRGTGLGLSLCQAVLEELKNKEIKRLDLLINYNNTKSIKMFSKISGIRFTPRGDDLFGMIEI